MCLNPITIPSQTKYISLKYSDRFLMEIPCGHCAECEQTNSNQWYYRAFYEWQELVNKSSYCLMDCLTYRDDDLPRLSDTWQMLDKSLDFPCFNFVHIRNFLQLLRQRLIRAGYSKQSFRYFLSSEYGTDPNRTHRPHYHILVYVQDTRLQPLYLSQLIADCWKYGRTDGYPYKTAAYVINHCVIRADDAIANKLRTCRYVTKYVQKSCVFQKELDCRLNIVMWSLANYADPVAPDKWLESEIAHRERLKLRRYVNQFHRQSQHFGETALRDLDLNQVFEDGCLYMPDSKGVKIPVPLPTYYKRKLFNELVEFNGSRYWQLNDLGLQYRDYRKTQTLQLLVDRYKAVIHQFRLPITDIDGLADYVYNRRGRIIADHPQSTLEQRCNDINLISYCTGSDKLNFGCRGLTDLWLGDSQQGYSTKKLFNRITLQSFIRQCCYYDEHFEKALEMVYKSMSKMNKGKQSAFEIKQRLQQIQKMFVARV